MSAETELYAVLSGAAGLTAIVSDRIFPDAIPEDKDLPAVVFSRTSTDPVITVSGQKVAEDVKFQIVVWAEKRSVADDAAAQIESTLAAVRQPATNRHSSFEGELGLYAATIETDWFSTT